MKIFILLVSFSIAINAHCQSWEKVDQRSESVSYGNALPLDNGRWLVTAGANPSGGVPVAMHFVTVFEANGDIAWEQYFMHAVTDIGSIAPYPDGGIVTAGPWDGCDYWAEDSLIRIDANGDLIWKIPLPGLSGPIQVAVDQAGNIITASDTIAIIDQDGVLVSQSPSPISYAYRMHLQNDTTLLLLSFDQLHQLDLNGVPLSTPLFVGTEIIDFSVTPGHIVLMEVDHVRILDHQLQLIAQYDLSAISPVQGFVHGGTGINFFSNTGLYSLDPSVGASLIVPFEPIIDHTVVAVGIDGPDLWTFGNQNIQFRSSAAARKRLMSEVFDLDEDIEVLVSIDSMWATPLQQNDMYFEEMAGFTVQVVNHTSSILDSCVVSLRMDLMFWLCGPPAQTWILQDLNLLPGDTFSLAVPSTLTGYRYASVAGTNVERSICVAALAPNNKLDRQPTDNHACDTAMISYPVGITERSTFGQIKMFPNPFIDHIVLDLQGLSFKAGILQIHDEAGRLVHSEQLFYNGPIQTIDLVDLAQGTYVLSLRSEDEVLRGVIIKADAR